MLTYLPSLCFSLRKTVFCLCNLQAICNILLQINTVSLSSCKFVGDFDLRSRTEIVDSNIIFVLSVIHKKSIT